MLAGWSRVTLAGKSVDVFEPASRPRFGLIFLHPVGGELASSNSTFTQVFQDAGLGVLAPHGLQTWWADRICPEFDPQLTAERFVVEHVRTLARERWSLPANALAIAGISMGGQGAFRIGFRYPEWFPAVGSIAGAFDYHEWYGRGTPIDQMYPERERCRLDTAILQIQPQNVPPHLWFVCDPLDEEWYRGNDRLQEKLAAFGIPHTHDLLTSQGGHTWEYFDAMARPLVDFLVSALQQQSRRLL